MQEGDGGRGKAFGDGLAQARGQGLGVQGAHNLALGVQPFARFHDPGIQRRGLTMSRANRSGRAWSPMTSASPNPAVATNRVLAPLRSSSALVATVVPILIADTRLAGNAAPGATSSSLRIPSTAASS